VEVGARRPDLLRGALLHQFVPSLPIGTSNIGDHISSATTPTMLLGRMPFTASADAISRSRRAASWTSARSNPSWSSGDSAPQCDRRCSSAPGKICAHNSTHVDG